MKSFDASTIAALDASAIIRRNLIAFAFDSGTYGFWDGSGTYTWSGITFVAGGQLIEVEAGEASLALESVPLTLRLYANPDAGITPAILSTIEAEAYHQRPVTMYRLLLNADTRAVVADPVRVWRGYIDQVEHKTEGDRTWIEGRCESRSIDYTRRGFATASNAEQHMLSTGDKGLEFCGVAGTVTTYFGRKSEENLNRIKRDRPVL